MSVMKNKVKLKDTEFTRNCDEFRKCWIWSSFVVQMLKSDDDDDTYDHDDDSLSTKTCVLFNKRGSNIM